MWYVCSFMVILGMIIINDIQWSQFQSIDWDWLVFYTPIEKIMQLPANDPRDPPNIIRPGTPVSCRPWAGRPRRCRPWRCLTWRRRMTGATSRPTCGPGWSWIVARRWALGRVDGICGDRFFKLQDLLRFNHITIPIGSMYGIYANIWGILMVNVTIYSIHGSYGIWFHDVACFLVSGFQGWCGAKSSSNCRQFSWASQPRFLQWHIQVCKFQTLKPIWHSPPLPCFPCFCPIPLQCFLELVNMESLGLPQGNFAQSS